MAEDRTGFDDIFDFNDDSSINKGLAGIRKLEAGYAAFVKQAMQQNEQLRKELNEVAASMKQAATAMSQVSVSTKQGRSEAGAMAAALHKQTKQYSDLKTKLQDQINKTRQLAKEHRDLQKSYNLLSRAQNRAAADAKRIATKEAEAKIAVAKKEAESKVRIAEAEAKSRIKMEEEVTRSHRRESERRIKEARKEAQAITRAAQAADDARRQRGGAGSVNDLRNRLNAATGTYNRMGANTPEIVRQDQLAKIRQLSAALNDANAGLIMARKGAIAARDSYAGLVQENARIMDALRKMPGAFDRVTGEINEQNQAVKQLQERMRKNTESLKQFDERLGRNFRNVGNYGAALQGVSNSMRQFALGLVGQFAGMYALAEATQVAFRSNLELSDSQAAVMKTVGLTKAEVDALAGSFKNLDTRTDLKGLFDIAKVGGQFGVAAKDIESFTEAANMAAVALSDEFKGGAEEVATELYVLRGLFSETRELDPGEALERIGSAINSLGASGAATGPVIAEFAKRLGQLGDMGPSIQDALGLGAALQELGLSAEIAAGGYTNIVIQLNKNAAKVAKGFGLTEEAFRKMLKEDPTELILQIATAMKGLENSTEIMYGWGIQSQESIKVMNSLGANIGRVREQLAESSEEFEKNTSIAKEFGITNENLAASWEKLKRAMLEPFVSGSIGGWLQEVIDDVRSFITFFRGVESQIATTGQRIALQAKAYDQQATDLDLLIDRYEKFSTQTELTAKEQEELGEIYVKINQIVGKGTMYLDEETQSYRLNIDAILEKKKALGQLAAAGRQDTQKSLDEVDAEEKRLREELALLKTEFNLLEEKKPEEPRVWLSTWADSFLGFNAEYDKYMDRLDKKQTEIYERAEELNDLLLKRQGIMRTLDSMTARDVLRDTLPGSFSMFTPEQWANSKNLNANSKNLNANKLTLQNTDADKEGKALKDMQDAAREARHQLELLEAQIAVTRAEWSVETGETLIDQWEIDPNKLFGGMTETIGFVKRELGELEKLYDNQRIRLDRLTEERIAQARKEAEEKRFHNKAGADGLILIEAELNEDIAKINRDRENEHIKMLQNLEKAEKKTADNIAKINQEAAKSRTKTAEDILDKAEENQKGFEKQYEKDVQYAEDMQNLKKEIVRAGFDAMAEMGNAYFDLQRMRLDMQLEYLRYQQEQELTAAGDNEQLKFEINERYRKKDLALRQKQAKQAKQQAIFNILLSTAQAVMQALAFPPGPPATIPLAAIIGAMGAAQLVVAASQPIPQFYRGVKESPEGPARVAETGSELAIGPDGKLTYYDKPQVAYLQEGTEVKTASETRAILSSLERTYGENGTKALVASFNASERSINGSKRDDAPGWSELTREMRRTRKDMVKAVKNQKQPLRNADGSVTTNNGSTWNTYVNKKYNRG